MNLSGHKPNIFIYGSCVSRDTYEYLKDDYNLVCYVARQSWISAGHPVNHLVDEIPTLKSSFQDRMVRGDFKGNAIDEISRFARDTDLVILDLIDERGGVIATGGGFVTKLSEMWSNGGRELLRDADHVPFGDDRHFGLWRQAADKVVDQLEKFNLLEHTVVLKAPWARLDDQGSPIDIPSWMTDPGQANSDYERYYDYLASKGVRSIEIPEEFVRTTEKHKWGISPFHYVDEAYRYIARELQAILTAASSPKRELHLERRELSRWGEFQNIDSFKDLEIAENSLTPVTIWRNGYPIDLLVEANGSNTTVVSFHAALATGHKTLPVFTGKSITDNLGVNRIFVSDPSLYSSEDLRLAWYLGSSDFNLTESLVEIINDFQELCGADHLVTFGMSGGGFAALNIAHEFPNALAIPVNPQTRILSYAKVHWHKFAVDCFDSNSEDQSVEILERHPRADMNEVYASGFQNTVLYVQNIKDAHVSTQLLPWFERLGWPSQVQLLLGDWGTGHVPPPARELKKLLEHVGKVNGNWAELGQHLEVAVNVDRDLIRARTGR